MDELTFRPVTINEWEDLQSLFAEPGVQDGCWCMYWRIRRSDFHRGYGESNKTPRYERYMGVVSTFKSAGFEEVIRRSRRRPIMRYYAPDRP
jgi:hypothetical protein